MSSDANRRAERLRENIRNNPTLTPLQRQLELQAVDQMHACVVAREAAAARARPAEQLSQADRALLVAAGRRIDQSRAGRVHESLRRRGLRPDLSHSAYLQARPAAEAKVQGLRLAVDNAVHGRGTRAELKSALRAALAAFPERLKALVQEDAALRAQMRWKPRTKGHLRKVFAKAMTDVGAELLDVLELDQRGPQLLPNALRSKDLFLQQDDFDDLIPDGWGRRFHLESARLAERIGVKPAAVPLLCLLTWLSAIRPAEPGDRYACGAGLQVSLAWLARKLGYSKSWVAVVLNELDPFASWRREYSNVLRDNRRRRRRGLKLIATPAKPCGTPYVHRFRKLVHYSTVAQRGEHRSMWLDQAGRAHQFIDVRGVVYLTDAGRRLLVRRARRDHRPRPGRAPELRRLAYVDDLQKAAARWPQLRHLLSIRLRRGHQVHAAGQAHENALQLRSAPALPEEWTPNDVPQRSKDS